MQLQIGNYRHRINEAGLTISHRVRETKAGIPYLVDVEWGVSGKLRNSSGNSRHLDATMQALERAYSQRGVDISLLHNDGRRSHHTILNSQTLGGVRAQVLAYPTTKGAEYCTYRSYEIRVAAVIRVAGAPLYIEFEEQITISGGGGRWGVKEVNEGPGVRQKLRTHAKCTATQSGRITQLGRYPVAPPPIWPYALESEHPDIVRLPPVTLGTDRDRTLRLAECSIQYSWNFSWPYRLSGAPQYARR